MGEAQEEPETLDEPTALAELMAQEDREPAPLQPEPSTEIADDGVVSRDATAEGAADALSGTVSAEKAAGAGAPETPPPTDGDAEATPSPTPAATKAMAPQQLEPTEVVELPPLDEDESAAPPDETEPPPAVDMTEPTRPEPEGEGAAAPLDEHREFTDVPRAPATFPWGPVQIGLGSTAIVLLLVTVWAWRLRR